MVKWHPIWLCCVLSACGGGAGCSPYVGGFYYRPRPAVAEARLSATQPATATAAQPRVTAYAIIVGVRRADPAIHVPLSIEVRLRLDNQSEREVQFDPRTLAMTTAQLIPFRPPRVVQRAIEITPHRPTVVEAFFPFRQGLSLDDMDMSGLRLRWLVSIDSTMVPLAVEFKRVHQYYFQDPNWALPAGYPYAYYGVGPLIGTP